MLADVNPEDVKDDDDNTSQATSFISAASAADDLHGAKVIDLDSLSTDRGPFECPYCRGIVQFKNQRAWRKHVFRDLRAYVCTFPDCNAGLFEDRSTWFSLEMEFHRRQWICLTCTGKTFNSEDSFTIHVQKVHHHISPDILTYISKSSSRPLVDVSVSSCPLCDSWPEKLGVTLNAKESASVPPNVFRKHLGGHQEQLAMFAVTPQLERDLDSDNEDARSGQHELSRDEVGAFCIINQI
jgi:hypothetical protein